MGATFFLHLILKKFWVFFFKQAVIITNNTSVQAENMHGKYDEHSEGY